MIDLLMVAQRLSKYIMGMVVGDYISSFSLATLIIIILLGVAWIVLHANRTPSFTKFITLCGIGLLENSITSAAERAKLLYAKRGILIAKRFNFDGRRKSVFYTFFAINTLAFQNKVCAFND